MKNNLLIALVISFFLLSNCDKGIIGPSLPDEVQGTWKNEWGEYYEQYRFTNNHIYWHEYASNTGDGDTWDYPVDEIISDECFTGNSYYYYYHIEGTTMHLKKNGSSLDLGVNWWLDDDIVVATFIKQ